MRIDSWQFVEKYYRLNAYASSYAPEFNLIPHESYWSYPDFPILHPDPTSIRGKGRPRSSRIRNEMDLKEPSVRVSPHDGVGTIGSDSSTWIGHTQGECTITLRDIAMLIGLPIDGDVVTGSTCLDWRHVCYSLLGLSPGDTDIDGQRLHLTWLSQSFPTLAPDADEESIQRYTRAYILQLIGGFLFSGKSSDKVHLMFLPLLKDFEVASRHDLIGLLDMETTLLELIFISSLGYHDPYIWYRSITIRLLFEFSFYKLPTRAHTRGTKHTSILRDAPSIDISLPPVQETPITPMEVPSTPPIVPLVASSPPSIEATLVDEELVHIANDDQQGQKTDSGRGRGRRRGRGAHGGLRVSSIKLIVEHAHHRHPQRKMKAPSCDTH
ncbi:hypothetical protein AAG906_020931 [Vitis piasezkii]